MKITIGLVGNPNCGKTTLFNQLTGTNQKVGNWPGVTVERKSGEYKHALGQVQVVDLPGTYCLSAASPDEKVAQDFVFEEGAQVLVNILDASNLERNLFLTAQLLEMNRPMVVAVNMMDLAEKKKIKLDLAQLQQKLGCPVVPLVASRGQGLEELNQAAFAIAQSQSRPTAQILYPYEVETSLTTLAQELEKTTQPKEHNLRWLALKCLEGEPQACPAKLEPLVAAGEQEAQRIEAALDEDIDVILADQKYSFIHGLVAACCQRTDQVAQDVTSKIDNFVLNRFLGIPIFMLSMYLVFMVTINLGGAFIDFFDQAAGALFVELPKQGLERLGSPAWLTTLLAEGAGGGFQTVATFIPPIFFMFLCLSILEDSGYMARAAFVIDRLMRFVGLPGKSVVPMMVGFGCNVPAIMASRTLEQERDRTLTVMMTPMMSCGARLPIYALFAAAFFPSNGQNLVFLLYLVGIVMSVFTGLLLKHTLLKGQSAPFIMELPPYHLPGLQSVMIHTWNKLKVFVIKAGQIIIVMVMALTFFNSLALDGSFGNESNGNSVLALTGKAITPVFAPMGLTQENWPATVGVFTGIFAKEAVVGTLDALYSALDQTGADQVEPFSLWKALGEALATIPANLAGLGESLADPLGISLGEVSDLEKAAEEQAVKTGTFGTMGKLFAGQAGAFAYMLFVLLYTPCVAALGAIYRETGRGWTIFSGVYLGVMGWAVATAYYQVATFEQHPQASAWWLVSLALGLLLFILSLHWKGRKSRIKPKTALAL